MKKSTPAEEDFRDHLPSYLMSIQPGSRAVYLIMLLLIILILAGLPLISVEVSVSGRGIIRPLQERTRILSINSGIVDRVYVKEGEWVRKSQALLQIRSAAPRENLLSLKAEREETSSHLRDLEKLTAEPLQKPSSQKYLGEYEEYLRRFEYLELLQAKAERELSRYVGLYSEGLISQKEYDDLEFEAEKTAKELEAFRSGSLSKWQDDYYQYLSRLRELEIQIRGGEERIQLTTVYSPASGNLIEFHGIFEGSAIQAGSEIGILSPESELIGEFFVTSGQIAYLREEQPVHLLLDALTARDWGVLPGRIYEISSDFILADNQPVYRIKCRLDRDKLSLRNGYSTPIKKGMTFQARIPVSRRTLFQLLSDKTANWLDPTLHNGEISLIQ